MSRRLLAHDIAGLVTLKLLALTLIYFLFFGSSHRSPVDPATHIAGPPPPRMDTAHGRR